MKQCLPERNKYSVLIFFYQQLQMPTEHLKANFLALIADVNNFRPKRPGKFITRVLLKSPPSSEQLKIDPAEFPFDDLEGTKIVKRKKGISNKAVVEEVTEETDETPEVKQEVVA